MTGTPILGVAVVVPVHNEEDLLPGCLHALTETAADVRQQHPQVDVRVLCVLDTCTDRSPEIVAATPGIVSLVTTAGTVGQARAEGVCEARRQLSQLPEEALWIACTDADTRVPRNWLATHVELADLGADLLVGTVEPDPSDLDPQVLASWWERQDLTEGHPHIHGANLGFRYTVYEQVGGFGPASAHEDVLFVHAVRQLGVDVRATIRTHVVTSGRLTGRAPEGFADYLAQLALPASSTGARSSGAPASGAGHG